MIENIGTIKNPLTIETLYINCEINYKFINGENIEKRF